LPELLSDHRLILPEITESSLQYQANIDFLETSFWGLSFRSPARNIMRIAATMRRLDKMRSWQVIEGFDKSEIYDVSSSYLKFRGFIFLGK
jgi:hypothetical protein